MDDWNEGISNAVDYIEKNIEENPEDDYSEIWIPVKKAL